MDTAQAQNRRVYLEEFTGAWCGYCVRGAYAEQVLEEEFPGKVAIISIHNDQGSTANDMMDNVQGDSMVTDIGFPSVEALSGFPDGWTARMTEGTNWNVDPAVWADSVSMLFENTAYTPGIVDSMLAQQTQAVCNVDSVSYNQTTNMVTARVTATFAAALTGDFRLNLMVTEDSVSGSGAGWDQHNYYSGTDGSVGGTLPNNPMYNYPESIPGWKHMHVFREAVGGIHGVDGIIPSSVDAGNVFSKTFTFKLPSTIQNNYYVHLIGLVHQYSATDAESNQVFDAMEVPLLSTPHAANNFTLSASDNQYNSAHAGGDTSISLALQNNGSTTSGVKLSLGALPTGWSGKFSPSDSVTVDPQGSQTVTLTLTAPVQASFATVVIQVAPQRQGVYIPVIFDTVYALSDNTRFPLFYDPNSVVSTTPESALFSAIPDSLKQFAAEIPLSDAVVEGYPPEKFPYMIFDNVMLLDNGGDEADLPYPSIVDNITSALAAGAKVFISSDYALGYAFDQSNNYFSQFASTTETPDVLNLYAQIGLDFTATTERFNSSTNALSQFTIKGETNDPVGDGSSGTDKGGFFSCYYTIDSESTESFYCDGSAKHGIGSTYIDSLTGARLVYLGFGLSELTSTSVANTIATNSIKWLLSSASAGVNLAATPGTGMTASPNPFNGISQIQYTAAPDELNVTFVAYDLLGRQVATLASNNEGGNVYSTSFDASRLAAGTYTIVAHSSKGTHEIRVVNQQ